MFKSKLPLTLALVYLAIPIIALALDILAGSSLFGDYIFFLMSALPLWGGYNLLTGDFVSQNATALLISGVYHLAVAIGIYFITKRILIIRNVQNNRR
jgi:multisubunit Na+/H+ antiporter MnhB subunit